MELQNLKSILEEIVVLLLSGNEMAFDGSIPSEIADELKSFIQKIELKEEIDRDHLKMLFLPTAPIQECSMANGWSDSYLEISSRFDESIDS